MPKYVAKQPDAQGFVDYTDAENKVWGTLIKRQMTIIEKYACDEFLDGLHKLNFAEDRIPQCSEVSDALRPHTGWAVEPVAAIIPFKQFFQLLTDKKFPAATFIRRKEELDYLQEPDIFHEFYGHCPLLTQPAYADFVQWYGENALEADPELYPILGRLFWFTIEFGLLNTSKGLRIYGGGILSSYQETQYALDSKKPKRVPFDLKAVINTEYRYDIIQEIYYIIERLDSLFELKQIDIIQFIANNLEQKHQGKDKFIC